MASVGPTSPVNHRVEGCTERIDVGPWALFVAGTMVLLKGGVAGGNQCRQGSSLLTDGRSCGTKINQYGTAIMPDIDIGRFDVSMDQTGRMYFFESIEYRHEDTEQGFLIG